MLNKSPKKEGKEEGRESPKPQAPELTFSRTSWQICHTDVVLDIYTQLHTEAVMSSTHYGVPTGSITGTTFTNMLRTFFLVSLPLLSVIPWYPQWMALGHPPQHINSRDAQVLYIYYAYLHRTYAHLSVDIKSFLDDL